MIDSKLDPDDEDTRACREDALAAVRRAIADIECADWSELDGEIFDEAIKALEEAARQLNILLMEYVNAD